MPEEIVPADALAAKFRRFQSNQAGAPTARQLFDKLEALEALRDLGSIRHMHAL